MEPDPRPASDFDPESAEDGTGPAMIPPRQISARPSGRGHGRGKAGATR